MTPEEELLDLYRLTGRTDGQAREAAMNLMCDIAQIFSPQKLIGELLGALEHMKSCGPCSQDSWETCEGGREALEVMAKAAAVSKHVCKLPPKGSATFGVCQECGKSVSYPPLPADEPVKIDTCENYRRDGETEVRGRFCSTFEKFSHAHSPTCQFFKKPV